MKMIPLTRGQFALVDDEDFDWLSKYKWNLNSQGYAMTGIYCPGYAAYKGSIGRQMHRIILNVLPGFEIDHINGNTLDNRRANLRLCNRNQNARNRGVSRNNTSGFKGVTWREDRKRWVATIGFEKRKRTLGYFKDIKQAVEAYKNAEAKLFGDFARRDVIGE